MKCLKCGRRIVKKRDGYFADLGCAIILHSAICKDTYIKKIIKGEKVEKTKKQAKNKKKR
jgi:hypothetical protein